MINAELYYEISIDDVAYDIAVNKNELEGEKVLLNAAIHGDYSQIEQLLKSGICVDAKEYNKLLFYASKNYFTPLQLATLHGHEKCVQLLIDHGADVNAKDLYGLTCLHLAACSGAYNILKILLKARASCSLPLKFSYCIPVKNSINTECFKVPYLDGTTPLHVAASNNNLDCVKELIRYGADFNAVDEHGRTSLYLAAQHGYSECVMIHLKEAVGRDILSLPSLKTSDTPLHFAVKYLMIDCVKELLSLGSDVNHRNIEGLSPLHIALLPFNTNITDLTTILKLLVLEGHKTDINQSDWEGYTPLHYTCFYGHRNMWCRRPEMAKFLISYGANVNIEDGHGCNLLVRELRCYPEENFEILKYIVKSLLYLPRLKLLNISVDPEPEPVDEIPMTHYLYPPGHEISSSSVPSRGTHYLRSPPEENFSQLERRSEIFRIPEGFNMTADREDIQRSFVMDAMMDAYGDTFDDINENQDTMDHDTDSASSLLLKKQLWYEKMASSPRTLQHHCRFLIRKILGPMKLKFINKLPLPTKLHSYLLFELEE